uniref:Unclassified n=4 Tax=Fusarium pseudograminearum TaxID=101028 RepID=W1IBU9_FUSPS|nr:unclassified [Fusarium pseudograminearum CS3220]CDL73163.1 unclassified [Fusarium pseudograminearum CS3427]CDL73251.1 unclassified [Fusarium pseudograminearum CS3487]CDL73339.1 unclassified [Fusarium pseudograminearum CS5834]CDX48278.1 unclassified [Fusarium pseudograminearum CS5834]
MLLSILSGFVYNIMNSGFIFFILGLIPLFFLFLLDFVYSPPRGYSLLVLSVYIEESYKNNNNLSWRRYSFQELAPRKLIKVIWCIGRK